MSEHRWLWAIASRCALYALALGLSFLCLSAASFGLPIAWLWLLVAGNPEFAHDAPLIFATVKLSCLAMATIGFAGGAIAGFYSPPREAWFPLNSPFFRRVLKNGVAGFFAGAVMGGASGTLVGFFFPNQIGAGILLGALCGQIYGLGRGLKLARCVALALPTQTA